MSSNEDIDAILSSWPFQSGVISARLARGGDGREVLQMRIELGLLQMETSGRPDGQRPEGYPTYLEYLRHFARTAHGDFSLSEEQTNEVDREFLQYYHRRICWLALREFSRAVEDADHTLALMDYVAEHSPDTEWSLSHEQYRPFVLFHRTQAVALAQLDSSGPEAAIEEVNQGLERIRGLFQAVEAEEHFDEDEFVKQLVELRDWIREQYHVGRTLVEQLADAVAQEQYELAARLRDEIAGRKTPGPKRGEGKREKGEGRKEKGEGRGEKGEGRRGDAETR
jgi:hypothetical protein